MLRSTVAHIPRQSWWTRFRVYRMPTHFRRRHARAIRVLTFEMTDECRCLRVPKSIGRRLSFRGSPFISVFKISLVTDRWQAGPTPYPYQSKESLFCEGFFPSRVFTWGRLLYLACWGDITVCHSRTTFRHHNMSLRAHLMSLKRCVVILGIKKAWQHSPSPLQFHFLSFLFNG